MTFFSRNAQSIWSRRERLWARIGPSGPCIRRPTIPFPARMPLTSRTANAGSEYSEPKRLDIAANRSLGNGRSSNGTPTSNKVPRGASGRRDSRSMPTGLRSRRAVSKEVMTRPSPVARSRMQAFSVIGARTRPGPFVALPRSRHRQKNIPAAFPSSRVAGFTAPGIAHARLSSCLVFRVRQYIERNTHAGALRERSGAMEN